MKHLRIKKVKQCFYAACIMASTMNMASFADDGARAVNAANEAATATKTKEITTVLLSPNYRGTVKHGDNSVWSLLIKAPQEARWEKKRVHIESILLDSGGKVLLSRTGEQEAMENTLQFDFQPPSGLPVGSYILKLMASDPSSADKFQSTSTIRVVGEMPKVYVDQQGFTVADGKRFFPLGVYIGAIKEEDLKRISEGGFNTVLSYAWNTQNPSKSDYLDLAEKHHLKVVYSLKDLYPRPDGTRDKAFDWAKSVIKVVHEKPALLAWYTNDELTRDWTPKLSEMYDMVRELDPEHPALMIQNRHYEMRLQAPYTDILGFDPYPVGNSPQQKDGTLTISSSWTRVAQNIAMGTKGVWMVPQIMDWAVYQKKENEKNHPPTLDEMRNQAYQMLINGSKGLIFYSYFDLFFEKYPRDQSTRNEELFQRRWNDVTAMAREIKLMIPTILEDEKVPLGLPEESEIEVAAWKQGSRVAMLFANPYYEAKSISFVLPSGWTIKDKVQGQIESTSVKSTSSNGKVTFTLPSVGSGVFYLEEE